MEPKTRYFVEILEDLRGYDRWFRPWVEGFESADEVRTAVAERLDYPGTKRRLVVETTTTEVIETL